MKKIFRASLAICLFGFMRGDLTHAQGVGEGVRILYEGSSSPMICDKRFFLYPRSVRGTSPSGETREPGVVRQWFDSGMKDEMTSLDAAASDLSEVFLYCSRDTVVIERIFASAHSASAVFNWPPEAEAKELARSGDTPIADPATVLASTPGKGRTRVLLPDSSGKMEDVDIDRIESLNKQVANEFAGVVIMPDELLYWPLDFIKLRSNNAGDIRVGVNIHGGRPESVLLLAGQTHRPSASPALLEISGVSGSLDLVRSAPTSSPRLISFQYGELEPDRVRKVAGLGDCDVGSRAGRAVVECEPRVRIALPWSARHVSADSKVLLALDAGSNGVVFAESKVGAEQTCIRFLGVQADGAFLDAFGICDRIMDGEVLQIAALSSNRAAVALKVVIQSPGNQARERVIYRVALIEHRRN